MKSRVVILGTFVVFLLLVSSVFGQDGIGFKGVGAMVGYIDPEGGDNATIAFGGVVDLGFITPNIGLEADILYWSKSYGPTNAEWKVSSIGVSAIAKYYFAQQDQQLRPFAGGGLGFNRASASWEYKDPFTGHTEKESDSDTDLAIEIVGGAKYALSPQIDGFGELRYIIAGDWDYWGIFAGIVYNLSK